MNSMQTLDDIDENVTIGGENQCLIFRTMEFKFGVMIEEIKEIVSFCDLFLVPRSKEFLMGVVNIRGNVVGVIDPLRLLRIGDITLDDKGAFIVVDQYFGDKKHQIAIAASEVFEVISIVNDAKTHPPFAGTKIDPKFIDFIFEYDGDLVEVLNIEHLFVEAIG